MANIGRAGTPAFARVVFHTLIAVRAGYGGSLDGCVVLSHLYRAEELKTLLQYLAICVSENCIKRAPLRRAS